MPQQDFIYYAVGFLLTVLVKLTDVRGHWRKTSEGGRQQAAMLMPEKAEQALMFSYGRQLSLIVSLSKLVTDDVFST